MAPFGVKEAHADNESTATIAINLEPFGAADVLTSSAAAFRFRHFAIGPPAPATNKRAENAARESAGFGPEDQSRPIRPHEFYVAIAETGNERTRNGNAESATRTRGRRGELPPGRLPNDRHDCDPTMTRTVWFECSPRPFFGPKRKPCHREVVDGLDVFEFRRRSRVTPYCLRMEARVENQEELRERSRSALDLAGDLDLVWPYVAGAPLFPRVLTIQLVKAPSGWRTNADRIGRHLPWVGPGFHAKMRMAGGRRYWMTLPYMPLKPALEAVRAYRTSDAATRLLIDLHTRSLKEPGSDTELILLAKALELVRAVLPGRGDADKQKNLQAEVQASLTHPFAWLYNIANNRLEVRHVVKDRTRLRLLDRLTSSERKDYRHDADAVLRGVITQRLGIELGLVRTA